jgi:hypothetical protein
MQQLVFEINAVRAEMSATCTSVHNLVLQSFKSYRSMKMPPSKELRLQSLHTVGI